MNKKEELLEILAIVYRGPGYDVDHIVSRIKKIDPYDDFLNDAIDHILGANGRGEFKTHPAEQNILWAKARFDCYINERLES